MEVLRLKQSGLLNQTTISYLVRDHNAAVVIIYPSLFEGKIPSNWVAVGNWTISNNVVCGDETVTFYAPDTLSKDQLRANLKEFSTELPPDIIQSGLYTSP